MADTGRDPERLPDVFQDDEKQAAQQGLPAGVLQEACLELRLPYDAPSDRLDKILSRLLPMHSRSRLQSWIVAGHVAINGMQATVRQRVRPGDRLTVRVQPAPESQAFTAQDVAF